MNEISSLTVSSTTLSWMGALRPGYVPKSFRRGEPLPCDMRRSAWGFVPVPGACKPHLYAFPLGAQSVLVLLLDFFTSALLFGVTSGSATGACLCLQRVALCEYLWEEMQREGIPPSNFTLTILIKMHGRMYQLQKAFDLVKELPRKYGFRINAHVYTCLMAACIVNKEVSTFFLSRTCGYVRRE